MGFLKFLLAIVMVFGGIALVVLGFFSCAATGISSSISGSEISQAPSWIMGVIGIFVFLGGVYMFRSGKA